MKFVVKKEIFEKAAERKVISVDFKRGICYYDFSVYKGRNILCQ